MDEPFGGVGKWGFGKGAEPPSLVAGGGRNIRGCRGVFSVAGGGGTIQGCRGVFPALNPGQRLSSIPLKNTGFGKGRSPFLGRPLSYR